MRIEHLKYFLEVAQSGSINAVAQHLFISQQGISDALKRMENELGVVLFKRTPICFDDHFIVDVHYNGTAAERFHGIAEDIPCRCLHNVLNELGPAAASGWKRRGLWLRGTFL